MDDQTIRLGLKVQGREDVESLRRAHKVLKEEVYDLSDSYEVLTGSLDTTSIALKSIQAQADAAAAAQQQAALASQRLAEAEAEAQRAAALEAQSLAKAAEEAAELAALVDLASNSTRKAAADLGALTRSAQLNGETIHVVGESYELLAQDEMELAASMFSTNGVMLSRAGVLRGILEADNLVEGQTVKTTVAMAASGNAVEGHKRKLSGHQMQVIATSYAIQDLASANGGLAQQIQSVSNNIPMIVGGLGIWGAAIGGVVAVGASLYQNWDSISRLTQQKSAIPAIVDDIERWTARLSEVNSELEKLRVNESLTASEMARYNALIREQTQLESKSNEEKQRRNELEALNRLMPEAQANRAAGFKKAVGESGGGEAVATQLRQAIENVARSTGQNVDPRAIAQQADQLLLEAASGSEKSRNTIQRTIMMGLPQGSRQFGQNILKYAPETIEAGKAQEKAQKEQDAAREKDRKLTDDLSEQGRENQRLSDEAEKKRTATEQAEAEKSRKDRAEGAKKRAEDAEKTREADRKALESGLGTGFLADAEQRRLAIESDPTLSGKERRQARQALGGQIQNAAQQRLLGQGVAPDRASQLAIQAPDFVQEDIQKQLDMLRAQGGPQRTADAMAQLQQILLQSIQQQQMTGQQLSRIEARNRELERMQGSSGWSAQRRVQ